MRSNPSRWWRGSDGVVVDVIFLSAWNIVVEGEILVRARRHCAGTKEGGGKVYWVMQKILEDKENVPATPASFITI